MKCPRCHRDTYSQKWQQCSACGRVERPEKTAARPFPTNVSRETSSDAVHKDETTWQRILRRTGTV